MKAKNLNQGPTDSRAHVSFPVTAASRDFSSLFRGESHRKRPSSFAAGFARYVDLETYRKVLSLKFSTSIFSSPSSWKKRLSP